MWYLWRSSLVIALSIAYGLAAPNPQVTPGEPAGQSEAALSPGNARQLARAEFNGTLASLLQTRDTKAARQGFLRSIVLDPTFAPPYFNLGVVAEADQDWPGAKRWFSTFLKLKPDSTYAARASSELNRIASIQASLRTPGGAKRNKYDEEIGRAHVFLRTNMPAEAIAAAREAADLDSSRWEAYAVTASALSHAGKPADARRFLLMAIQRATGAKKVELDNALKGIRRTAGTPATGERQASSALHASGPGK